MLFRKNLVNYCGGIYWSICAAQNREGNRLPTASRQEKLLKTCYLFMNPLQGFNEMVDDSFSTIIQPLRGC